MIEWFRHDVNAHDDIKIKKLLKKHGFSALGVYWFIVEILFTNDGRLEYADAVDEVCLVDGLTEEEAKAFIDLMLDLRLLYMDGSALGSHRVDTEFTLNEELRQKKIEAGRKGGIAKASNAKALSSTATSRPSSATSKASTLQDITRQDNITTLTNVRVVGDQQADAPTPKEANTDLFGEKIKVETDIEKVPFDEIANYWNSKLKGKLPSIREITAKRKSLIRQRWHEYKGDVYTAIDNVAASDFLTGWKSCGFDWCFGKDNFIKIIEGNYRNGNHSRPSNRNNNKSFRPRDINGQYDNEELEELTEL